MALLQYGAWEGVVGAREHWRRAAVRAGGRREAVDLRDRVGSLSGKCCSDPDCML